MNFPVSPSAGFTLKKQYVKYLFEVKLRKKIGLIFYKTIQLECRLERRPIAEEEIRKIVDSAQRKREKGPRKKKGEEERAANSPGAAPGMTPRMTPPPPGPNQAGMYPPGPPGQHPFNPYAARPGTGMFPPHSAGQPPVSEYS